ncbi:MAG: hypothetical protein J2P35_00220 [Actinobacteria bacterium]|nr:hypothetical protein [Actinomycetota bacterium]
MITIFGVTALTFMMVMYALEGRHRGFVLAFAAGCALSSAYGFLSGAWPFGAVEGIWTLVAARRWLTAGNRPEAGTGPEPGGGPEPGTVSRGGS